MPRARSAGGRLARFRFSLAAFPIALLFATGFVFRIVPAGQSEKGQARQEPAKQEPAEQEHEEPVYDLGPGITPPRVVHQVPPQYSSSKGVRLVGAVTIALVVTSQGLPKDPQVVKSLEKDFDKNAVEAVRQWRFDPAKKEGKPVAVRIALEIEFRSL